MYNKLNRKEITELFLRVLRNDILNWQERAIAANQTNEHEARQNALQEQGKCINSLIKLVETYNRQFS